MKEALPKELNNSNLLGNSVARTIYLSLGSNIDKEKQILFAIDKLKQHFTSIVTSPIYETEAVGFEGENFYNLVVSFKSTLSHKQIETILKQIERDSGRVKKLEKFSARTLDIDILLIGDEILLAQGINIPRDEIIKYSFVLKPLKDIAKNLIHPLTQKTILSHWHDLKKQKKTTKLVKIEIKP